MDGTDAPNARDVHEHRPPRDAAKARGAAAMSDRIFASRAFRISLSIAALAWIVVVVIQWLEPEPTACGLYKGQSSEGYERSGNNVLIKIPTGGAVTLQNFTNGAAGIMLTTRSADPARNIAGVKC